MNPLKKRETLDKKAMLSDLAKAEKDIEKKPNNSSAIALKSKILILLGRVEEFKQFINTVDESVTNKPKVALVIADSLSKIKTDDEELLRKYLWIAFDDYVFSTKSTSAQTTKVKKTAEDVASGSDEEIKAMTASMKASSFYIQFISQKNILDEFIEAKIKNIISEAKELVEVNNEKKEEVDKTFKVHFANLVDAEKWEEAWWFFLDQKLEDEKQHKTALKLANYLISINEFKKAYDVINYCLISAKKNKEYLKIKAELEEKLGLTTQEIKLNQIENEINNEVVIEEKSEKRKVVPLNKQIRDKSEIKSYFENLEVSITDGEIDEFIVIYQNEITKANAHFEIASAISKFMLQNSRIDDALKFVDESIRLMNQLADVKDKKQRKVKKLKYQILHKGQRFDEAEAYLEKEGISLSSADKLKLDISEEVVQEKNTNFEDPMNAIKNKYHSIINEKSIKFYSRRIDEYINDRQFFHKFGVEVPAEVVTKIKEKIALDLKYLDFEIREVIIPYLIKIESSMRYAFDLNGEAVIYKFLELIHNDFKDDHKFIFDIDKIKVAEGSVFESNQKLLMEMLSIVYRVTRNHVMHGSYNVFGITMNEGHIHRVNKDLSKSEIDNLIENFDSFSMSERENVIQGISSSKQMDALYDLEIVKNIMSKSAIENRRVFGLIILLLYISNPYHTFMNIASSIDNSINLYRNRTVFGSKDKLYESLGLNVNWLKAFE